MNRKEKIQFIKNMGFYSRNVHPDTIITVSISENDLISKMDEYAEKYHKTKTKGKK